MEPPGISRESLRRRITAVILSGVGLGSVGHTAGLIVSSLAAEEIAGEATWSGLPAAMSILGTAAGTTLLAEAMRRWGRRPGLITSYSIATAGALLAISAVIVGSLGRSGSAPSAPSSDPTASASPATWPSVSDCHACPERFS